MFLTPVVVIGAGPVGLYTALRLAQAGIKVNVFESGAAIDQSPRACVYFPAVLEDFSEAGILDEVSQAGEENKEGCDWRDAAGNVLCGITPPPEDSKVAVFLSQPELCDVVLIRLLKTGNGQVFFNHTFQTLEQKDGLVTFKVKNSKQGQEIEGQCRYLIGADGGRSTVRKSIGAQLEGFTWDSIQFVALNYRYDLGNLGWKGANFMVDPVDWGVVVKRGKGDRWRFATGVHQPPSRMEQLDEATLKIVKERLFRLLPGDTSKIRFEAIAPYTIHQRCASTFKVGNVVLAGDAAHLNNPVGGLGLTTGMLDAAHLARDLVKILVEDATPSLLDEYAEMRRAIFLERTNPITTDNLLRLFSQDPIQVEKRQNFIEQMNDKKNIAGFTRVGLADFALSTKSDKIFDTSQEITWFISTSKLDDWSWEKFEHEYKVVHAKMMLAGCEQGAPVQSYIQLPNSTKSIPGAKRPGWDFVSSIKYPSLFLLHAGLQDPGYKATAGAHMFCRLDQQGCLATQVRRYERDHSDESRDVRVLVFHKRRDRNDKYTAAWLQSRADKLSSLAASDSRVNRYALWKDAAPQSTEYLFSGSQFAGGSWKEFKAVEAFDFEDQDAAVSFFGVHQSQLLEYGAESYTAVVGVPDVVV